jgi:tRNA dimethylallyltransferase
MGPTACGKSDLAIALAARFGGEIINSDSMQVYRHLPIGTAAPTAEMYATVPHHLFEYRNPDDECDAGAWSREAADAIRDVWSRGRLPVVVGGTFFWVKALFEGLSEIPAASDEARLSVSADLKVLGSRELHAVLAGVDPVTASRLEPADSQRISRALEVWRTTGVPLSDFHQKPPVPAIDADVLRLKVQMDRRVLYGRINKRLGVMIESGLVAEVENFLALGFPRNCRAMKSSSFAPVLDYLDKKIVLAEMAEVIAQGHRNYAKRQITWLKRESGVDVAGGDVEGAVKAVQEFLAG